MREAFPPHPFTLGAVRALAAAGRQIARNTQVSQRREWRRRRHVLSLTASCLSGLGSDA
jgi:hypothetical protein